MITKSSLTAIAAFAAMALSNGAFAAPSSADTDVVSVKVALAGLDLRSDAGAKVALSRIHQAARHICGGEPDARDLSSHAMFRTCEKDTVDRAVTSLGSPMVIALNAGAPAMIEVASLRH
jgi:UrcA family protein